ncbi:MAG: hypothetical protein ABIO81_12785 [Ginsengibacter sp.]
MSRNNFITTTDFKRLFFKQLIRYRYVIIISTFICGLLLYLYVKSEPFTYTSQATIFSLSNTNDNPGTSSALRMLLGSEAGKSFNEETSVNIIELAQSRAIREAVAAMPVPSMGNKIIAALLIDSTNAHRGLIEPEIQLPEKREDFITSAANILDDGLVATINKNNSFVLAYTGRSEEMVRIISYGFIEKISQFYVDIKREKAKRDYEFATSKVDSLRRVMRTKDYKLIEIDKKTLFTNTDKMQFRVPTENLVEDKQLIRDQYTQAVINQQAAAYKLQKDTPVIKVLDKPDPPYEKKRSSAIFYAFVGFLGGAIFICGLITARLLFRYMRQEVSKALFSVTSPETTSSTASAL